ncbi:NucA/NucB deoxyribonuclease domain-containing protein [Alloactinosynnema sp. L-07]|uniref:NucA/NucB deoxyribonuclease domain-containing protein n=1 Tax=Alloactinosynnema sp. L-07 TaxID=1653480 RepID=UPI0012F77F8F|nr:NucA/NucB deoxyribonuclease domain-containing protein [Alloactinosynnema sp. L-07]
MVVVVVVTQVPPVRDAVVGIPVIGGIVSEIPAVVELFAGAPNGMAVPEPWRHRLEECTPTVIKRDRRCGELPVLPIDAKATPYIARNISIAWSAGKPALLTLMRANADANRAAALSGRARAFSRTSLDEYPMATTGEGGKGARVEEVPENENNSQGETMNTFYYVNKMADGDQFLVVILNPHDIARDAYKG